MTGIADLIKRQRAEDNPPPPAKPEPEPVKRSESLDRLIARAKAYYESRWDDVEVILAGEIITVSIGMLQGDQWCDLTGRNAARDEADKPYGYNRAAVARAYPAERIKLNHATTDADTWQAVWDLIRGEDPANVQAVMWWLHIGEPTEQLRQLRAKRDAEAKNGKPDRGRPAL